LRSIADIFGMVVSDIGAVRRAVLKSRRAERPAKSDPPASMPAGEKPASKQCSTCNSGEYAFLEDSRYTSQ
jgi:hypothetical protein